MASPQQAVSSESDEDFHSANGGREESKTTDVQQQEGAHDVAAQDDEPFPEHPLKSMKGPFEESIVESDTGNQRPVSRSNAEHRRQKLLDATRFDDSWTTRWKQRPDAQYHPLLKLTAQITFGMHLLQQNQARSDKEVVRILQNHVDEVDNFLEQTAEDFDLAIRDIDERIRFLQLPMQHIKVFNIMLDDQQFRSQLLEGNDKIERIIDRTARAMNAALSDVSKGRQATRELSKYLNGVQYTWPTDKPDLDAIFNAMRGNEEGWKKCYKDLQAKGNALGNKLIELGTIISEMSKMAATASRRVGGESGTQSPGVLSVASSTMLRSRFSTDPHSTPGVSSPGNDKPLPRAPLTTATAERSTPRDRPMSFHQRFEKPREVVPMPTTSRHDERPRTAGSKSGTATPRRTSGPLSSHPPSSRPQSSGNDRAHVSPKVNGTPRSTSQPMLQTSKLEKSAAPALPTSNKEGPLSQGRDPTAGSAFSRRWSIRKKHTGTSAEGHTSVEPPRPVTIKSSASSFKSASMPRLSTITDTVTQPQAAGATSATPALSTPVKSEPKSRISSMRLGSEKTRQSVLQNLAASEASKNDAPSMASSIKRRTLSVRNLFGRRKPTPAPSD